MFARIVTLLAVGLFLTAAPAYTDEKVAAKDEKCCCGPALKVGAVA